MHCSLFVSSLFYSYTCWSCLLALPHPVQHCLTNLWSIRMHIWGLWCGFSNGKGVIRFIPVLWNKANQILNCFTWYTARFKLSIETDCLISVATETYEPTLVILKHMRGVVEIWSSFSAWDCCDLPALELQKDVRPQEETPWLVLSLKFNSTCYSHPSVMRGLCSKEDFRLGKLIYGAPELARSL